MVIPYAVFPPRNGGQLRCFYLLRELARQHEVHLVIMQAPAELQASRDGYVFPEGVKVYSPLQTPPPRTAFDRLPARWGPALQYRWLQRSWRGPASSIVLKAYHLVAYVMAHHCIDVVILEHLGAALLGPLVRRCGSGTLRILDAHNIDHRLFLHQMESHGDAASRSDAIAYEHSRYYETHLAEIVDAFFACSDDDRNVLSNLNGGRMPGYTIPNGVDVERRPYDSRHSKWQSGHVLFCGTLNYAPNRDGLLWFHRDVWPLVRRQNPNVQLMVVGQGAANDDFLDLRYDPSVQFIGAVDDVVPYYKRAGVAVVPLRQGSGTRLKLLEAMSMGNPVVSTRIGAEGIEAQSGEHLLLADVPDEFAAAITSLVSAPERFDAIRQSAHKLVSAAYDWQAIGGRLNDAIDALVQSRGA